VDTTVWLALAGIGGTLLAALVAPAINERMRRRSAREERLLTEKIAIYTNISFEVRRAHAYMSERMVGRTPPPVPEDWQEQIGRMQAQTAVVASKTVRDATSEFFRLTEEIASALQGDTDTASPPSIEALTDAAGNVDHAMRIELGTNA
jgi:hypothetical protein